MDIKEQIIADITAKVEAKLASQKVELANINDLVNELKKAEKLYVDFNNLYGQVDALQPKIVKIGNEISDSMKKMNLLESTFTKQFAELGLKFSDYPEYKNISYFMSKANVIPSMTSKIAQL